MATLGTTGERRLLDVLLAGLPGGAGVRTGAGDDAAVVRGDRSSDLVLKTDAVVEGVHFTRRDDAVRVGHKALGRVLSDFAAMGATPEYALVSLAAPRDTPVARIRAAYEGMAALAKRHRVAIVGGETVRGPTLSFHVFAAGRVPRGRAVLRAGASRGDVIFVTGTLGGSLAGRHLDFEPRVDEGRWLMKGRWATAMIDLSDGLATDLRHLVAASQCGADLDPARIPVSAAARVGGRARALDHALRDGEDFELLFTVKRARVAAFVDAWEREFDTPCTAIGAITGTRGRILLRPVGGKPRELRVRGFEHFRG